MVAVRSTFGKGFLRVSLEIPISTNSQLTPDPKKCNTISRDHLAQLLDYLMHGVSSGNKNIGNRLGGGQFVSHFGAVC